MSSYYARVSGKVYGPFTREQLVQMASSGRVNSSTEVSTDQNVWTTAATALGLTPNLEPGSRPGSAAYTPPGPSIGPSASHSEYLQILRNHSRYPFYRTAVLVAAVVGYLAAVSPFIIYLGGIIWFGLSSFEPSELLIAAAVSVFVTILVTVFREIASMFADLVDSTLDHHSRVRQ